MGYAINPFQTAYAAQRKDSTLQAVNVTLFHVPTPTYHASGIVPHPLQLLGAVPTMLAPVSTTAGAGAGPSVGSNMQGAFSGWRRRGNTVSNSPRGPRIAYPLGIRG